MLSNSAAIRFPRVPPSLLSLRPGRGVPVPAPAPSVGRGRAGLCAAFPQPGQDAAVGYLRAEARWDLFISPRGCLLLSGKPRWSGGAGAEVCWVEVGARCLEREKVRESSPPGAAFAALCYG